MANKFLYKDEARKALEIGVNAVSDAVKITIGPKGRNVVLQRPYGAPLITNDGVTIAKEISLEDPFENMGAQLIKEVSIKTNDVAGDGTTTACVIAQAMVQEGLKNVAAGANPIILKKGILTATEFVVDQLKKISKPIDSTKSIAQVASISAGDEEIGELISKAMEKVGNDSIISVDEAKTLETTLSIVEGMQFDRGYASPYLVTDTEKMEILYNDAYILITDKKINTIQEIVPILEIAMQNGLKLMIIADDIETEALSAIVLNKLKGIVNCAIVKAPAFGDRRKAILEDIAILTGGQVISSELGLELQNVKLEHLGHAKQIKIDKDNTTIIGGSGNLDEIKDRAQSIRKQLEVVTSEYDKDKLKERLAKLTSGIAVINVGAATEVEMKEKKLRIEDALAATKAAVEEGIIPGGGVALLKITKSLEKFVKTKKGDEKTGADIVLKALSSPISQIAKNAGVEGSVIINKILNNPSESYGYDALNDKYCDLINAGIIDPTKVARSAIQNAASVAATLLTTEVLVSEIKEPFNPLMQQQAAGGMMY